ncbi:winged helix-turn-helix domain-containing protein [Sphingomonas koreensis]|nr:winged helix-turn-helix domain-containing protein [Sphingomonas koreensis]
MAMAMKAERVESDFMPCRCGQIRRRDKKRTVKIGEMKLQLCRVRHAIVADGRAHRLPDLSFRLLDLLASRAPAPVSFAEIEQFVWNAQVTRETIKQRVTMLRESLTQAGINGTTIEAVRNHGYRTLLTTTAIETGRRDPIRSKVAAVVALVLGLMAAVSLSLALRSAPATGPAILAVAATPPPPGVDPAAWDSLRRGMVRALSKFEGLQVVDHLPASGTPPSYLVRAAIEPSAQGQGVSIELVEGGTGAVLFAEQYRYIPTDTDRAVLHFANNIHPQLASLSANGAAMPDEARLRYAEAFRLWRLGDLQSLNGARERLHALASGPEPTLLARSLLARVQSDLVLRHGAPGALARQAELQLRPLIATHPGVGDLRYSLSRSLLAQGKRQEALDQLRIAQRTMPFLSRDIIAIEGRTQSQIGGSEIRNEVARGPAI